MTDTYQAVYDAVRSKISNGDIGYAVECAFRQAGIGEETFSIRQAAIQTLSAIEDEQTRPCVLLRPKVYIDGNQWCALYGPNLMEGIAGFGNSPSDAMHAFDKEYHTNLTNSPKEDGDE